MALWCLISMGAVHWLKFCVMFEMATRKLVAWVTLGDTGNIAMNEGASYPGNVHDDIDSLLCPLLWTNEV